MYDHVYAFVVYLGVYNFNYPSYSSLTIFSSLQMVHVVYVVSVAIWVVMLLLPSLSFLNSSQHRSGSSAIAFFLLSYRIACAINHLYRALPLSLQLFNPILFRVILRCIVTLLEP